VSSPEVEQSFRNLVMFYRQELIYIDRGRKASDFFSDPQRQKLVKQGILERFYVHRGCRLRLTDKAKTTLESHSKQVT
jgi:hypothetical protein